VGQAAQARDGALAREGDVRKNAPGRSFKSRNLLDKVHALFLLKMFEEVGTTIALPSRTSRERIARDARTLTSPNFADG
jgi:hypothetical protein